MSLFTTHWKVEPQKSYGVLCGADKYQEWLLPWWWERYSAENDFPVTFVDFGMSQEAKLWCQSRGNVIALDCDTHFMQPKEAIDPALVRLWDSWNLSWGSRAVWFKKPFALLYSPYACGIWLDLDCEVLGSLTPLFSLCPVSSGCLGIALAREWRSEHLPPRHPDIVYNGGVIVFHHGSWLIQKWAEDSLTRNAFFAGDDFLLSQLIHEHHLEIIELEEIYNWRIVKGVNINAIIVHWVGKKNFIKYYGGIKPALDKFL